MKILLVCLIAMSFPWLSVAQAEKVPVVAERAPAASQVDLDGVIKNALTNVVGKIEATKGRVAVMDFPSLDGKTTGLSSYISNKAANKLIEVGRQVVDRATLEKVISEQKLQQNALMDAGTAAKVGKLAGAGVFIIGNYTQMSSKFVLTVRALSVESGQFIPGAVSEETIKPVPTEMVAEINELTGVAVSAAKTADLSGGSDSSTSTAEPAGPSAEEQEFNKDVCKIINKGIDLNKIYGIAVKSGLLERPDDKAESLSDCKDSSGETGGACLHIGSWSFTTNGYFGMSGSDIAKAIKGKAPDRARETELWLYSGADFPGLAVCAPNGSEWNEKRGSASKAKKK